MGSSVFKCLILGLCSVEIVHCTLTSRGERPQFLLNAPFEARGAAEGLNAHKVGIALSPKRYKVIDTRPPKKIMV